MSPKIETQPGISVNPKVIDPVCGREVSPDSEFVTYYKDNVYYFCSAKDKAEFDRHPDDYVIPMSTGFSGKER